MQSWGWHMPQEVNPGLRHREDPDAIGGHGDLCVFC